MLLGSPWAEWGLWGPEIWKPLRNVTPLLQQIQASSECGSCQTLHNLTWLGKASPWAGFVVQMDP